MFSFDQALTLFFPGYVAVPRFLRLLWGCNLKIIAHSHLGLQHPFGEVFLFFYFYLFKSFLVINGHSRVTLLSQQFLICLKSV